MSKSKENIKVLAGIVSFNSDVERLKENVNAIYPQVDKLVIFDNGSKNINEIQDTFKNYENLEFLLSSANVGIAKALSEIMNYAIKNNYDWVLTLDDDSVAEPDLIDNYKKFIHGDKVATMTCRMQDRNYDMKFKKLECDFEFVDRCITSGCFMSVDAYCNSDGYSVDFFIDRVDDDICYNLTRHGFKHILINYMGLLHEMGTGEIRYFLWHKARAVNYSPMRRYYIFRNETIIRKKYPELIKKEWLESGRPMWINFVLSSLKILLYEGNKKDKMCASWKGWKDGRRYVKVNLKGV